MVCLIVFILASIAIQYSGVTASDPASGKTYAARLLFPREKGPQVYVQPWLGECRYGSGIAGAILFALGAISFAAGAMRKRQG